MTDLSCFPFRVVCHDALKQRVAVSRAETRAFLVKFSGGRHERASFGDYLSRCPMPDDMVFSGSSAAGSDAAQQRFRFFKYRMFSTE
jgi:hypothetical protein